MEKRAWRAPGRLIWAALTSLALVPLTQAQITGSAHDLSPLDPDRRLCIFCHTPHGADTSVADAPLWNHMTTNQNYVVYDSPTLDAVVGQPAGASRLCLSCHDGTVAVDAFGSSPGSFFLGGPGAIGADGLLNDHPISFQYTDSLSAQDGELHPPSVTSSLLGSTIDDDLLFNGSMECSSCHDVHRGPAASAVNDALLVIPQTGSTLCLVCHNK
jgi:predicted CXXCH cytochrome family protein